MQLLPLDEPSRCVPNCGPLWAGVDIFGSASQELVSACFPSPLHLFNHLTVFFPMAVLLLGSGVLQLAHISVTRQDRVFMGTGHDSTTVPHLEMHGLLTLDSRQAAAGGCDAWGRDMPLHSGEDLM